MFMKTTMLRLNDDLNAELRKRALDKRMNLTDYIESVLWDHIRTNKEA